MNILEDEADHFLFTSVIVIIVTTTTTTTSTIVQVYRHSPSLPCPSLSLSYVPDFTNI